VVDFDGIAVSETLFRVRHDTRRNGYDLCTGRSREVDPTMERLAARERDRAMAEVGRNPALRHGPAARNDLTAQVSRRDHALEHTQLTLAIFDLPGQLVEHLGQIRRGGNRTFDEPFRPADRRRRVEI